MLSDENIEATKDFLERANNAAVLLNQFINDSSD
jgi:hypothetical protein